MNTTTPGLIRFAILASIIIPAIGLNLQPLGVLLFTIAGIR
jgi:hypothetical protein